MLNLGGTLDMCGYGLALNDLPEVQHLSGDINHEEQRQLDAWIFHTMFFYGT